MRAIYFYTGSINGVDALGHYVRAGFGANACVDRAYQASPGCEATFDSTGETSSAASASTTALLDYLLGPGDGGDAVNARPGRGGSIAANPVLIGAATVLVVLVAVFLSYNANNGLPFVPTYELTAEVPERVRA